MDFAQAIALEGAAEHDGSLYEHYLAKVLAKLDDPATVLPMLERSMTLRSKRRPSAAV